MAIRFVQEVPKPVARKPQRSAEIPVDPKPKHAGGRPKSANPKVVLNIRVDADVLARWKASGKGWQSRINEVLKAASL